MTTSATILSNSITAETIRLLRRALALERSGQAELLDGIRAEREPVKDDSRSAAELIQEDRER